MAKKAKAPKEEVIEVPAWVVSFADMITLLLAFFVLLQAFALEQQPELFLQGQGAFKRSIAGLGIPSWFLGHESTLTAESQKRRYQTEQDRAKTRKRVISAKDQKIRRAFRDIKKKIETSTNQQQAEVQQVMRLTTRFARGKASLSAAERENIIGLANTLRQNLNRDVTKVCVFGWANDMPDGKDRWILASRRAEAVADVLRKTLGRNTVRIVSMGGGPDLTTKDSSRGFIKVVIMKAK